MQSAVLPERYLSATNGARCNRASGLAVYSKKRREVPAKIPRLDIEEIPLVGVATVVDEVQHASLIDSHLRLDPTFRHAKQTNTLSSVGCFFGGQARERSSTSQKRL